MENQIEKELDCGCKVFLYIYDQSKFIGCSPRCLRHAEIFKTNWLTGVLNEEHKEGKIKVKDEQNESIQILSKVLEQVDNDKEEREKIL